MTTRRHTPALREGDGWTCRVYEGDKCVAIITSTASAEDAERAAARHVAGDKQR